jgi:transposase-like protein
MCVMTMARHERGMIGATVRGHRPAGKRRGRPSQWSDAEKRALVELTNEPGSTVTGVAREFGLSRTMLYGWRHQAAAGGFGAEVSARPVFARVEVREPVSDHRSVMGSISGAEAGQIVVDFPGGARVWIDGIVDPAMLEVVLAELGR